MNSYQQYCALARTLEVAGDRWTLLIVRELVPGPRRFTDLLEGLPGVSRNLLTERLRGLERDGIVERSELPPPSARTVYELTADGRELADAMVPLIGWGARRLGERREGERFRPRWSAVAMAGLADREAAEGVNETYQYVVDGLAFHFVVDDGSIELRDGPAPRPAVLVTTDEETFRAVLTGELSLSSAAASRALTVAGNASAVKRMRRIFSRRRVAAV